MTITLSLCDVMCVRVRVTCSLCVLPVCHCWPHRPFAAPRESGGRFRERFTSVCAACTQAHRVCTHHPELGLRALLVGHNPSTTAWKQGYFYANPGNAFMRLLKGVPVAGVADPEAVAALVARSRHGGRRGSSASIALQASSTGATAVPVTVAASSSSAGSGGAGGVHPSAGSSPRHEAAVATSLASRATAPGGLQAFDGGLIPRWWELQCQDRMPLDLGVGLTDVGTEVSAHMHTSHGGRGA